MIRNLASPASSPNGKADHDIDARPWLEKSGTKDSCIRQPLHLLGFTGSSETASPTDHCKKMSSASPVSSLKRSRSMDANSNHQHGHGHASSWFLILRWIMLGIGIGSSTTSIFHAVTIHSVCPGASNVHGDAMNPGFHPPERVPTAKQVTLTTKQKPVTNQNTATKEMLPPPIVNFTNLPPPPQLGEHEDFAACLLIKDDNHWLIEWLAYHYQVMPLRHLVIVVDPDSKTSPLKILERWSERNLMKIHIWTDKDFIPDKITAKASMFDNNTQLMMHRVRQNNFYQKCIRYHRNRGREWLMLVDTDEYILPSYASGHFRNLTTQVSFLEPGSVLRLLKYHEQVTGDNHTCVYMPRFFFGAQGSPEGLVKHLIPDTIDAMSMLTQRFLFREPSRNRNGKNLMNLQRVRTLSTFGGVHHISLQACPDPDLLRTLDINMHALVRVHHYLGTKEQYFFRDDPRMINATTYGQKAKVGSYKLRDTKRYNQFNERANHEDHAAKAWLRGFVNAMGENLASVLLKGVGKVGIEQN